MAYIIMEGDPWQLEELLAELYDRHYLPGELNVKFLGDDEELPTMKLGTEGKEPFAELDAVKILKLIVDAINDEWHPAFREPILSKDDLRLLEAAEALLSKETQ